MSPPRDLGRSLRAAREERGYSLSEVAEATEISASFLSLVENGKSDITVGRLQRLVEFYGISITDLLPMGSSEDSGVMRGDEQPLLHSPAEGIDVFLLVRDMKRTMMPMVLQVQPGAELAEHGNHPGEEFLYVMEGRLELELSGVEPAILEVGDSAYYYGDRKHRFRNADPKRPLRILCVDSPPVL